MSIRLVISILNILFLKNTLSNRELVVWIHSPRTTDWGTWGHPEICPKNSWVGGMRLKIETSQGWHSDDTALNAVQLQCVNLDWIYSGNITSASGKFGRYHKTKYCPKGFATGYQLRSENHEPIDDVGAVDFKLKCSNFDGSTSYAINTENVLPWGTWSPDRVCPPKTAFCGLRTQVETKQGGGDDTSLNNVDLACCDLPDPAESCKLETKWETAVACPKYRRKCEMKFLTGIAEDKKWSNVSKFYEALGFIVDLRFVQKTLEQKAKNNEIIINGKSMESIIGETKINKIKMSVQLDCEGIIQQLIIICGYYKVYTKEYRCVPNGDKGRYYRGGLFFQPSSLTENILWSYNCDFNGGNITNKESRNEDCGDLCYNDKQCTHFTWSMDRKGTGTCWMKGNGVALIPIEKYDDNLVCGWIERS